MVPENAPLDIQDVLTRVAELDDIVAALAAQVDELRHDPSKRQVRPWDWRPLEGEALRLAWMDLHTWVTEQTVAHDVADALPRCWFQHWGVVSQLIALQHMHRFALEDATQPAALYAWHNDFLRTARDVWPTYAAHQPHGADVSPRLLKPLASDDGVLSKEFLSHVDAGIAARAMAGNGSTGEPRTRES